MLFYLLAILLTGDILPGDILLAILFTGDIIDWRYFAWRYNAGDIWLAIFLPYTGLSRPVVPEPNLVPWAKIFVYILY